MYLVIGKNITEVEHVDKATLERSKVAKKIEGKIKMLPSVAVAKICKDIALTMKSGMPILDVLETMMSSNDDVYSVNALYRVHQGIEEGKSVSVAFEDIGCFPKLFIEALKVGEKTGDISASLETVSNFFTTSSSITKKISSSFVMPTITIIMTVGIFIFMLVFLFPKLRSFASDAGVTNFSGLVGFFFLLADHLPIVIIVSLAFVFVFLKYKFIIVKKIPGLSRIFRLLEGHLDTFFLASTLFLGINAGIDLRESLALSVNSLTNKLTKDAVESAINDLNRGLGIGESLDKPGTPIMIRRISGIGEKTGKLGDVMKQVSDQMVESIKDDILLIEQTLPTAMTLLLGVIVSFMLIAFYSTYFGIFSQLSGGMK